MWNCYGCIKHLDIVDGTIVVVQYIPFCFFICVFNSMNRLMLMEMVPLIMRSLYQPQCTWIDWRRKTTYSKLLNILIRTTAGNFILTLVGLVLQILTVPIWFPHCLNLSVQIHNSRWVGRSSEEVWDGRWQNNKRNHCWSRYGPCEYIFYRVQVKD